MSAGAMALRDERPFHAAMLLAVLVHAAAIFGLTFAKPPVPAPVRTLEVTLARFNDVRVRAADFLAQQNQSGSGDATSAQEMRSTSESAFAAERDLPVPTLQAPPEPATEAALPTIARLDAAATSNPRQAELPTQPAAPTPDMLRHDYLDVAHEVATLSARLAAEAAEGARGPRVRRITSVSTRTAAEAYYVNSWRREIEQLGNLNFPEDQRRARLYGSMRLLVAIEPSGALREVSVLESSGQPLLDQAAVRIVRLAAPFPPFPPEMRARMDVLEIIRTWSFRRTAGTNGSFAM